MSAKSRAEKRRARQSRVRDVIDVRKPVRGEPTPEQMRHARYEMQEIVDSKPGGGSITIGKAFRRLPKFEAIQGLGDEQLRALRYYRSAFDRSEMSETRCALDIRPHGAGGSHGAITAVEARAFAQEHVRICEAGLRGGVNTLRSVALMDASFSEVAMARFGSREISKVVTGKGRAVPKFVTEFVPRSGRHREAIRLEFFLALNRLVMNIRPYLSTGHRHT